MNEKKLSKVSLKFICCKFRKKKIDKQLMKNRHISKGPGSKKLTVLGPRNEENNFQVLSLRVNGQENAAVCDRIM